jgi:ubiquinone/menaquinone biosynthesis C-methylase UbiE
MNTIDLLTKRQKLYMDDDVYTEERNRVHESWFDEMTTDFWRHNRMYETIRPFATSLIDASWLTVGDGRYGLDAIRLKRLFGLQSVFPTDIGENMLRISKERGMIDNYGVENAEMLSFQDSSFDVVFCKEAFHHFPRPYLALYEMLRVCNKAVVMIEPAERLASNGAETKPYLIAGLRLILAKLLRKGYRPYVPPLEGLNHSFEEAGNYIYTVSIRELEKLVHGMALGGLAWKGINDMYVKGCEFEEAKHGNPIFDRINWSIAQGDKLCKAHPQFHQPNLVSVIIFKSPPEPALAEKLTLAGFQMPQVQQNPYL